MNDQISPHPFPTDGATTAGERRKPRPSEKTDDEALRYFKQSHSAPCDDPSCDSAYCYVAERLVSLRSQLAEREQQLATAKRNEALMTERYDFWLNIARGAAEECGLPLDGPATDLRPAIMALRAALAEAQGVAQQMDELHLRKIDLADRVIVMNVGGYIGDSTRREIAYATARGKPVSYLESAGEPSSSAGA